MEILLIIASLFIQGVKHPNYLNIGFKNGIPIFRETRSNKIFLLNEQGSLAEFNNDSSTGILECVNDCASIYIKKDITNKIIYRNNDGTTKSYHSMQSYIQMNLSGDCSYFAFEEDEETISVFKNG